MDLAPVVLFVYNRPDHTKKTVEALKNNYEAENTELFIYADNCRENAAYKNKCKVEEVRKYIRTIKGFKEVHVIEALKNKGLANSVISGVTEVINKYGKVIVLEDDLITSRSFIKYMNKALEVYKDKADIWSISGYTPPINLNGYDNDIYITKRGCSWGWATWKDKWSTVNWSKDYYAQAVKNRNVRKAFNETGYDMSYMLELQGQGKIDSWAIRWCYNQFVQNKYTVYPAKSFVKNIGTDNSGTHSGNTKKYDVDICLNDDIKMDDNISENKQVNESFKKFYSPIFKITVSRYARKIGVYKSVKKLISK
ncbi:glycosyltransferase family protein [Clostridium hydrogenum]|uniref:glycosyltransferase n=1 Tax=Clostridium hydrogenum TaxID=2855764 RepID=UPI001F38E14E|nr:glycosyltransferase [Clostridium hydrogenum]